MTEAQLRSLARLIKNQGPDRVVVDDTGYATTSKRAREVYGVYPVVIYLRDDAWSLGAPIEFKQVARDLWSNEWIAQLELHNDEWVLKDMAGRSL